MDIMFNSPFGKISDLILFLGKANCASGLLIAYFLFFLPAGASAIPGELDSTFGSGGIVTASVPTNLVEQDRYGRIIVAGLNTFVASRFNSDGSPDLSFGNNGTVQLSVGSASETYDMAIQPDAKVILAGWARVNSVVCFAVVRFDSNGILDTSFGNGGIVTTEFGPSGSEAKAVKVQADGKIVVAGFSKNEITRKYQYAIARYNPNGSLDNRFGRGGKNTIAGPNEDFAFSLALQSDGKIVVGGYSFVASGGDDFSLARFTSDGRVDEAFGNRGMVVTPIGPSYDRGYSVAVQTDGKIVLGGDCFTGAKYEFCLARFNPDGTPDVSFDVDGKTITSITSGQSQANSVLLQNNGKILLTGHGYNGILNKMAVVRYNIDGSLDLSFGNGGSVMSPFGSNTSGSSATLQSDGKILLVGRFNNSNPNSELILRYNGDPVAAQIVPTNFDFDGDGRADISVFRPEQGVWYWVNSSTAGDAAVQFGIATDKITPADFDGDGKTDLAVYRDGLWYVLRSSDFSVSVARFGLSADIPVVADYDGDGRADYAVFRQGVWYILNTSNGGFRAETFGLGGDRPIVGDFDGDGKSDLNVYRNGSWYVNGSSLGVYSYQFGLSSDKPVASDYDGDGKTDFAVYREGQWYLQRSSAGFGVFYFGIATDQPVPADYDGDGKSDAAVYRNGVWYVMKTTGGIDIVQFGLSTDGPIPAAFLP